jgi:DNA segregation ATPase FtsK/SpoIIIE, S-DNA-T family
VTAGEASVDLEITASDDDRLADVVAGIARALRVAPERLWSASAPLREDLRLAAPELAHGAVLGWGRTAVEPAALRRSSALELHVTGGPEAGRALPLGRGRHLLGRGGEAGIRLDDPDVSRCHIQVEVGAGGITAADLGSTNGSRLDGSELAGAPRPWHVGSTLRLGANALTVRGPAEGPTAVDRCAGGRLAVRPIPRTTQPVAPVEIAFPRAPERRTPRRLAWIAVALPAVGGVLMAVVLHTPTFLFFALLSPLVALATWISERWSGRRTGRRERAEHAAATRLAAGRLDAAVAQAVRAAEEDAPDLAALTTAARRRSRLLWSRPREAADTLTVRIGTGPGATTVVRLDGDGGRSPARAEHLPVTVDLRDGGLSVVGPRARAVGVLSAALVQLTALSAPGEADLVLLLDAARVGDWTWTRWLPHLAPDAVAVRSGAQPAGAAADDEALAARLNALIRQRHAAMAGEHAADGRPGWLVVLVDRTLDARLAGLLADARASRVVVLQSAETPEALPVVLGTVLRLGGETGDVAVLSTRNARDRPEIATDRVGPAVAGQFARDLAALAPASTSSVLPAEVRLRDLPTEGLRLGAGGELEGEWTTDRGRLRATIGRTADGTVEIDLCRDGPHALIAGTTGSGKSELLQSLITGLALTHPPDRCSFLLVDYKGGAAFADAAALPHTVGVVTDLDGQTTVRALRSLAAELTRREAILGAHRVTDIAGLPAHVPLARLVIVVDEFASLAEELPSFVPGLVSIAQRGRSLGVHLVLATQRPSGVVSPEIRANCTLRICLRTTDESDSRDVLGTPAAAFLPVAQPGRAYLRAGHAPPSLLQVARVAVNGTPGVAPSPEVRRWSWPAAGAPLPDRRGEREDTDLAQVTRALAGHAIAAGIRAPHRPWRAPLPDQLEWSSLPAADAIDPHPAVVQIGLVDLPDRQSQAPLELDLSEGGTWLVVGGVRSGRSTVLRTVLGEASRALDADALHVHVLDPGSGALASDARRLPHTGTAVGGADALRTVRLVDRLVQEVAARRAAPDVAHPNVLVLIDGIEAISALLDDADPGRGSDHLHRLMRDGSAAGFTCVVTADRAVPGGRLAAVATHRLVLPLADRADYAVAGVPPRCVPEHRPPGRGLLDEDAAECQIALPRPLPEPSGAAPNGSPSPLRIAELPADPAIPRAVAPHRAGTSGAPSALLLPIGPGGDEGHVLTVDLARTGGLLVAGPPGSGRTAALAAFTEHLRWAGAPVLRVGRGAEENSAGEDGAQESSAGQWLHPADVSGLDSWLAGLDGRTGVLVVDDLGAPAEEPVVSRVGGTETAASVALVVATGPGCLSSYYQGPVAALRRSRSGLLLCPGPGDADLMGVRLPRTPVPVRPGSGWLITGGAPERIQVARRRSGPGEDAPGAANGQSSSSRGPISWVANQASSWPSA